MKLSNCKIKCAAQEHCLERLTNKNKWAAVWHSLLTSQVWELDTDGISAPISSHLVSILSPWWFYFCFVWQQGNKDYRQEDDTYECLQPGTSRTDSHIFLSLACTFLTVWSYQCFSCEVNVCDFSGPNVSLRRVGHANGLCASNCQPKLWQDTVLHGHVISCMCSEKSSFLYVSLTFFFQSFSLDVAVIALKHGLFPFL